VVLGDHRDSGSVDGVGLAGMPGVQQPTRAAIWAGTSTTGSSAAARPCATLRPSPAAPSTAHRRCGHCAAQARSRATVAVDLKPDRGTDLAGGLQDDRGERALVGVDPDSDHGSLPVAGDGEPAPGNLTSGLITPLLSHAAGARYPPRASERADTRGLPGEHRLCTDDDSGLTLHLGERFTVVRTANRRSRRTPDRVTTRAQGGLSADALSGGRRTPYLSRWTPRQRFW
jgi:hypothetical protein